MAAGIKIPTSRNNVGNGVALLGFAETGRAAFLGGSAGCIFCFWAVLYLCLPGNRRKFESAAVKAEYVKAE